jgi:hypothetical protein
VQFPIEFANTALNFTFDLARLEQFAAHTSMRKFQVRIADAPRNPQMRHVDGGRVDRGCGQGALVEISETRFFERVYPALSIEV